MSKEIKNPGIRSWSWMVVVMLWMGSSLHSQSDTNEKGWGLLSRYLYADAAAEFRGNDEASKLGLAASLLNKPPVTPGKIRDAEAMLREVQAANVEGSLYARYLLVRIAHLHREATVEEVETGYREVVATDERSPVSQVAASHLALVLLYQRTDLEIEERLTAAAELESVAARRELPEVAISFFRTLAGAAMYYGVVDERVLEWLKAARALQSTDELIRIGVSLQLAEVSRILGLNEEAARHYREFIADAVPTDQRVNTAKLRLSELEVAR